MADGRELICVLLAPLPPLTRGLQRAGVFTAPRLETDTLRPPAPAALPPTLGSVRLSIPDETLHRRGCTWRRPPVWVSWLRWRLCTSLGSRTATKRLQSPSRVVG
jgi:hypothetical protein